MKNAWLFLIRNLMQQEYISIGKKLLCLAISDEREITQIVTDRMIQLKSITGITNIQPNL